MIVLREDVQNPKPDPMVYIETAKRMHISSAEQIVFEDSVVGVQAGMSAQSLVIAVPTIQHTSFLERLKNAGAKEVFLTWEDMHIEQLINKYKGMN